MRTATWVLIGLLVLAALLVALAVVAFGKLAPPLEPRGAHRAQKPGKHEERPAPLQSLEPLGPRRDLPPRIRPIPQQRTAQHREDDTGEWPEVYPR